MYIPPLLLFFLLLWLWGSSRETEARLKALEQTTKTPSKDTRDPFIAAKETIAACEQRGDTATAAMFRAQWGKELLAEARAQGRFPLSPAAIALQGRPTPHVN